MSEHIRPDENVMRTGTNGRPNSLNDTAFAKEVATYFANGCTRAEMAEVFDVSKWTITQWRKDPRVKAHTTKLIEDRILAVTRKVDSIIEARLQDAENMSTKDLLAVRKEYVGGALRQQMEKADDTVTTDAMKAIEENPEFMDDLQKLISGGKSA